MKLDFHKSRSMQTPPLLDTESSNFSVFIRKNVEEIDVPDMEHEGEEQTTHKEFEYDEAILSKDEYKIYTEGEDASAASTQNQEAIAEIAELMETYNADTETAITDGQVATAELAELVDSYNTANQEAIAELAELINPDDTTTE